MQKNEKFSEGLKTCNVCREKARRYQQTHKEDRNRRSKEYQQQHVEKVQEWRQTHMSKVKEEVITCEVCNYEIKKYKKAQNKKSQTHQYNLKKLEDPDVESDVLKPDAIKRIDGKERYFCETCRFVYLPCMWKQHFEKQQHLMFVKKQQEELVDEQ